MDTKKILGMSSACFWAVVAACVAGIVVGSFCDYEISVALANVTDLGKSFATWVVIVPNFFYAAAAGCLYVGLRRKGKAPAWTVLVAVLFYAVCRSEMSFGSHIRELFGYEPGLSSVFRYLLTWLFWVAVYSLAAFVMTLLLDDADPAKLVAIGAAILVTGILAGNVNTWLKSFASRPRYKYLLQLDDPAAEFRQWWQMVPFMPGGDNLKSWPSGHMATVTIAFTLPLLTDAMKLRGTGKNIVAFCISCFFVLLVMYNRIHMTNHFLSDACFGTLISYLLYAWNSIVFMKIASRGD